MRPSELDTGRWRELDDLLDQVLEAGEEERAAILDRRCQGDPELRRAVEELLAAHDAATGPLDRPLDTLGAALLSALEGPRLEEGARVGPFRIEGEVGRGGMGVVYRAEDTRLGRTVALKMLRPSVAGGPEAERRFLGEARAVSALDHPNVATLHEIGITDDGHRYMVFAHYEGETLDARIARGPVPPSQAVEIAVGIAAGLAEAHRRGVVHRDVKPSNVLLPRDGGVKLLDFGVAEMVGQDPGHTRAYGTAAYMSPEQAEGHPASPASDLWSLGVVLYEMLAGERPFRGSDTASVLASMRETPPAPPLGPDGGHPEVETVVARLLAPDPDDRFLDAGSVVEALEAAGGDRTPSGPHPPGVPLPGAAAGFPQLPGAPSPEATALGPTLGALFLVTGGMLALGFLASVVGDLVPRGAPPLARVAVLPPVAVPADSAQLHRVHGVHTALAAELASLGGVEVVPPMSTERFRDRSPGLREIAAELGADAVLDGVLTLGEDTVELHARLVDAGGGATLWEETHREGADGAARLPARVAASLAPALGVEPPPGNGAAPAGRGGVDPDAYDAYLRGVFNLDRRSPAGYALAERFLRRALELDPGYAPAYAALAEVYGSASFFGLRAPAETLPRVRELLDRALALDPELPQALATLAAVRLFGDWDWAGAEAAARRALAANPSHPDAYRMLSETLTVQGRQREAWEAVERASRIDRGTQFSAIRPAVVRYYIRDFQDAARRAREAVAFFPEFWQGYWVLCLARTGGGEPDAAVPACQAAVERSGRTPMALGALGYTHALAGDTAAARAVVDELEARAGSEYVAGSFVAMVHGALGEPDAAFAWLDRAYEQRDLTLIHLRDHAYFDPLHGDPRFGQLTRRVGIPETGGP